MKAKWKLALSGVCAVWMVMGGPGAAQAEAYKCGPNSYSQQACNGEVINTEEHRAPAASRTSAVMIRRLPGESDEAFALRTRRAALSQSDQDECKRLDTKIPFEQVRLKNAADADDSAQAQEALTAARKRFSQLRC